jgi:ribosome-interacting GTPase 1
MNLEYYGWKGAYTPLMPCRNKIDAISIEELDLLYRIPNSVPISVKEWL